MIQMLAIHKIFPCGDAGLMSVVLLFGQSFYDRVPIWLLSFTLLK